MTAFLLSSLFSYAQYTACWQAEDVEIPAGSDWRKSTTNTGYSGSGYLEWWGGDKFGSPTDAKNILTYTFTVPEAGTYQVYVRGRRGKGQCGCSVTALDDACNDIHGKMDNGSYIKTMVKGTWEQWIWGNNYEYAHGLFASTFELVAGTHTYKISGRSSGVQLDGFAVVKSNAAVKPSGMLNCTQIYCETKLYTDWDLTKSESYEAVGVQEPTRNGIQINTTQQPKEKWAAARSTFKGETGKYDIVLTSLLETDGECSYKVLINGNEVLQFKNKRILNTNTPDYTPYSVGVRGINIPKDAAIQVDFISNSNKLVPENGDFAWARGRWKTLSIGNCSSVPVDLWFSGDSNDVDGDGIPNTTDNCPDKYNPNQEDMDQDGMGDLCDDDSDADGILNTTDNCPFAVNPGQEDRDGDGIGDVCDPNPDYKLAYLPNSTSTFFAEGMNATTQAAASTIEIAKAVTAPVIDGIDNDPIWASSNLFRGQTIGIGDNTKVFGGNKDGELSWKAAWDETALYMNIKVKDDTLIWADTNSWWKVDGMELYVTTDAIANNETANTLDRTTQAKVLFQTVYFSSPEGKSVIEFRGTDNASAPGTKTPVAGASAAKTYDEATKTVTVEVRYEWDKILTGANAITSVAENTKIRIGMMWGDNDAVANARDHKVFNVEKIEPNGAKSYKDWAVVTLKDIVNVSGVQNTINKSISIYPNPATSMLNFSKNVDAEFVNLIGEEVMSVKDCSSVDISLLNKGFYLVKINNGNSYKLLIE